LALKILIVDPDETWSGQAKKYFIDASYEVTSVFNGKEAQLAIYNEKFFAIILNYATENHSCMQVLKFIKSNSTNQRVIVLGNDQKILDEQEVTEEKLQKIGVSNLCVKPFEMSLLKEVLEGHLSLSDLMSNVSKKGGVSEETEVALTDENFTSIKINEFYSSQAVLFDIYIRLSSNKYLKILHTGDTFSKERLDKYKNEKKVESLYFHNNDRRKFITK
jgi:DNA-binding NtrC family response regulator